MNKTKLGVLGAFLFAAVIYFSGIAGDKAYEAQGWTPDPQATQEFIQSAGNKAYLSGAAPHLFGDDKDETVLLYPALVEVAPGTVPYNQLNIGSCVSYGTGLVVDINTAIQVKNGTSDTWLPVAEESIYGGARVQAMGRSTSPGGDGASGAGASKFLKNWGCVFRKDYPDLGVNLSKYSVDLCRAWGYYGSGGRDHKPEFDKIAREHPVKQITMVRTAEECKVAIQSGYAVAVCSNRGFTRYRDKLGFSEPSGSWSHCLAIVAYRNQSTGRIGFLIINSWGSTWNSGPLWPPEGSGFRTQPLGSFWSDWDTVDQMLRQMDSYAYSDVVGFPKKKLSNNLYW